MVNFSLWLNFASQENLQSWKKLTIDSKKFTIDKKRSLWIVVNGVFQCLENRNSKMKQIVS